MWRRQWRDAYAAVPRWYGLGTISFDLDDWAWNGHTDGFQGTITRTVCVPSHRLTVSVLTSAADGMSHAWVDGVLHILRAWRRDGAPSRRTAAGTHTQLYSTLPLHTRSPACSCASLRSLWSTHGRTCTAKSVPMLGAQEKGAEGAFRIAL